jgi:hypothetical protein
VIGALAAHLPAGEASKVRLDDGNEAIEGGIISMGLIGHELQHTIEVLSNRQVTSSGALYLFLSQEADAGISPAFETIAAKRLGETVRTEVRPKNACAKVR